MNKSKLVLSGIILMIQGSFAFSFMALCVKFASETLPSLEIVFFRSLFGVLMIAWIITKKKISFFGKEHKLLTLRGLSGFTALALHFYTLSKISLGTGMILNYTSPIFVALFAILFLGEKPGLLILSMIGLAFGGVSLLLGFEPNGWHIAFLTGILSAIFAAISYVLVRAIKHKESPFTIIFYFTGLSTVSSAFFLPGNFMWPNLFEWLLLIGVGLGSFYGQLWMTISLRRTPASIATPFSYVAPILTFFYGFLFFDEKLSLSSLLGVLLIILAGCVISWKGTRRPKIA